MPSIMEVDASGEWDSLFYDYIEICRNQVFTILSLCHCVQSINKKEAGQIVRLICNC